MKNISLEFNKYLESWTTEGVICCRDHTCLAEFQHIEERKQFDEWETYKGYKFQIYHDHLINNKPHFHLEKKTENINNKFDFDGNLLKQIGKNSINSKTYKILKEFLFSSYIQERLIKEWNELNPEHLIDDSPRT